jgi:hypothetical protein
MKFLNERGNGMPSEVIQRRLLNQWKEADPGFVRDLRAQGILEETARRQMQSALDRIITLLQRNQRMTKTEAEQLVLPDYWIPEREEEELPENVEQFRMK